MEIAICEDETVLADELERTVRAWDASCRILTFPSAEALLSADRRFDLYFLDIGLPGADGFTAAKRIRAADGDAMLVFLTADERRVFEAFDLSALHYLKKPVSPERLREVLDRARSLHQARSGARRSAADGELVVKSGDRYISLRRREIRYVESRGRKLVIAAGTEMVEIYGVLGKWEERLGGGFFRCHRSYLVNLRHVKSYDGDAVTLRGGARVWLARDRYADFVKTYMRFLQNGEDRPV